MSRVATSGVSVRALREFGLALGSGPFRVAFVLSLIVHLVLLAVLGWGGLGREEGGARRIPLMRVRLLSPANPDGVPAAPAIEPAVRRPRREPPGRPAAAIPEPLPAPTPRAPETIVSTVTLESGLAPVPEVSLRGESRQQSGLEQTAQPSTATEAEVPAPAGAGSGGSPAAGTEREGSEVPGAAAADAGATGGAAAAATASRAGPGLRDLAAVRHRIDAHKVYPQIAVRNGWEGRVLVEMRLEGDGSLTTVRLLEGSGYAVLDDATIVAVRRASPFPPIARVLTVPVEYRLVP